jgi:hypothetical protein
MDTVTLSAQTRDSGYRRSWAVLQWGDRQGQDGQFPQTLIYVRCKKNLILGENHANRELYSVSENGIGCDRWETPWAGERILDVLQIFTKNLNRSCRWTYKKVLLRHVLPMKVKRNNMISEDKKT